jgi:hypothetical protein
MPPDDRDPVRATAQPLDAVAAQAVAREAAFRQDVIVEYVIPRDARLGAALATVEDLLERGQPEVAMQHARSLDVPRSPDAAPYEFMRVDKLGRAALAIADRHFVDGRPDEALRYYDHAWQPETAHPAVQGIAVVARDAIEALVSERGQILDALVEVARRGTYDDWCRHHERLRALDVFAVSALRDRILFDGARLIEVDPERAHLVEAVDVVPGGSFQVAPLAPAAVVGPVRVDVQAHGRVPASLATPLVATMLTARARRFAVAAGLTLTGERAGAIPIFRYAVLRDRAKELAAAIERLDGRAHAVEVRLDDLSAVFVKLNASEARAMADVAAAERRAEELTKQRAQLERLRQQALDEQAALEAAREDCDCDWWCWAAGASVFITSSAIGVGLGVAGVAGPTLLESAELGAAVGVLGYLGGGPVNCSDLNREVAEREQAAAVLKDEMERRKEEVQHEYTKRDALMAELRVIEAERVQAQQHDAARALDTRTLGAIRAQYNRVREALVTQAIATARMAETTFNYEHDADLRVVRSGYLDAGRKGYAAGESLRSDLEALDHFHLTTHRTKRQQLSHIVSLRRDHPMSFVALKATGRTRFTTDIAAFDRAFPGTFLQRIKEVRVEVAAAGAPAAARGYLSNEGLSSVRIEDHGGRRRSDRMMVVPDPDPDIAKLCFKRLERWHAPETAAFSAFRSPLFTDRLVRLQTQELNHFENLGIETSWRLELLPDQLFDRSLVSDVLIHIQYEARFDENLKHVIERKRYHDRRETGLLSARELLGAADGGNVFAQPVTLKIQRDRVEAPHVDKRVVDVGFLVLPRGAPALAGQAELSVAVDGGAPVLLTTDAVGVVATAPDHPAGTGVNQLALTARGKSIHVPWTVEIVNLPGGLVAADVADVMMLLHYEYAPPA